MGRRARIAAAWAALAVAAGGVSSQAGDHEHSHPKSTTATPHTFRQAGYPQYVSPLATESFNRRYSGDSIGGGQAFGGQGRCANEGTWGWDYTPFRPMSRRFFLGYSHGRRSQGGTGAYNAEGPRPIEHLTESIHGHLGGE